MRVIYYAEPRDVDVIPKQVADTESLEARWVSLEDFPKLGKIRATELLTFGGYVEAGGPIHPMSMMDDGKIQYTEHRTMRLCDGKMEYFEYGDPSKWAQ